ncbi:MAG: TonB-dependent siderophore receptor [Gammaproteobacteria bacterium]
MRTLLSHHSMRPAHVLLGLSFICAIGALPPPAIAADAAISKQNPGAQVVDFSIRAQSLAAALTDFAEQSGFKFAYDAQLTRGLSSEGLSGRMSGLQALRKLLTGTGLTFRFTGPQIITIEKSADTNGTRVLGPVRVEGAGSTGIAGMNGSTDATATEGSKSYTSSALGIASKTPQSMRETPQSVSVITQQRMRDQNLNDFNSMMNQATGVSIVTNNSSVDPVYYSRGFVVNRIQIDGGPPLRTGSTYYPQIDMAMFDHVEILRGADGLFNGYGDPGGVVNLTRKRPLDHSQVTVEGQSGSWSNYRAVIDGTAPLGFDGRLRGRAVMSYEDRDFFYDIANENHTLAYGILEMDVTPDTLASVGVNFTKQDSIPFQNGLPRYDNGDDMKLPRGTCLCFEWNRWSIDTKDAFAQLEQHFGTNWSAKLNLTRTEQVNHRKYGFLISRVNPVGNQGSYVNGNMYDYFSLQTLLDFTLNGAIDLFGHRQELVVGTNYAKNSMDGYTNYPSLFSANVPIDPLHFDPKNPAYAEPATPHFSTHYLTYYTTQRVSYANVRLTPFTPLHLITGVRYSSYDSVTSSDSYDPRTGVTQRSPLSAWTGHNVSWPPTYSMVYDVTKTLSAYASYTDIYVSSAYDLQESGSPVEPVTGSNVEAGLKFEGLGGRLNGSIAGYRIEQKHYPVLLGYGPYTSTNGQLPDGIHRCCYSSGNRVNLSQGFDAEVSGELTRGWQASAGYTFNENVTKGSDAYARNYTGPLKPLVSLSPKHMLKLWSSYQFQGGEYLRRVNVGGGVNSQTKSYVSGSNCVAYNYGTDANGNPTATCKQATPFDFTQGFYAVFSARVAYQIDSRWNAALNINNVADRVYYQTVGQTTVGNWYGEPRNYMLTLRGRF